ncbi:hypothetical protein D9619_004645 [Psilocybe cf. subviscida]|uniref:Uncharacterized protein n=1 Tax=Psilocybe cf. subviscida TaxID=2480587 RepID=A0A8H5BQ75_9AGAR|nr:hypothetical protein D9619_004645 [Psilocybe cf. subviscida]
MPFFVISVYILATYLAAISVTSTANAGIITQTQTLYYVPMPTPTFTNTFSLEVHETAEYMPVATLEGGSVTRYQKVNVQSLAVVHYPSPINSFDPIATTIISQPVTRTFIFEEGSATYRESAPPSTTTLANGVVQRIFAATENCALNIPDKVGSCVRVEAVPAFDDDNTTESASTVTESWTGSLVPYATITSTAEGPTSSGSASRVPVGLGVVLSLMAAFTSALLL